MRSATVGWRAKVFRVLRFWNNEIDRNLESVLTLIDEALRFPHPASQSEATLPPRRRGGGMELDAAISIGQNHNAETAQFQVGDGRSP